MRDAEVILGGGWGLVIEVDIHQMTPIRAAPNMKLSSAVTSATQIVTVSFFDDCLLLWNTIQKNMLFRWVIFIVVLHSTPCDENNNETYSLLA